MNKAMQTPLSLLLTALCLLVSSVLVNHQANAKPLPDELAALLLAKLLSYELQLVEKPIIHIHVVGNSKLADNLRAYSNNTMTFNITEGKYPEQPPDVFFVNSELANDKDFAYSKQEHLLSVIDDPDWIKKGFVLAVYDDLGMPGVQLNLKQSNQNQLKWQPSVLDGLEVLDD